MVENRIIFTDQELQIASHYFRYHVRMYVETLCFLQIHPSTIGWDTERNAVLEDHLVHARILIEFVTMNNRKHKDDVLAIDYFFNSLARFDPIQDDFLTDQSKKIGGQLVHLTSKAMPELKSQQHWPIVEIKDKLIPAINEFLNNVPETRLAEGVIPECLDYLERLRFIKIPFSLHAAT